MVSIALLLFFILDPFGNLIVINALLSDCEGTKRRKIILREAFIATVILLATAFFGDSLLSMLSLKEYSIRLSGGIVLFLIALGMLFPNRRITEDIPGDTPLIVPIAMPLIAGPSALSMVILFADQNPIGIVLPAILIACACSTIILLSSSIIARFLGKRGSIALERLMGMLLVAIAVQMFLQGIREFLGEPV